MAAESQVKDGKILVGTPLHRLNHAAGNDAESAEVYVGDVADVIRHAVGTDHKAAVDFRRALGTKKPGEKVDVPVEKLRELVAAAVEVAAGK
jgi:hypothetical protein